MERDMENNTLVFTHDMRTVRREVDDAAEIVVSGEVTRSYGDGSDIEVGYSIPKG